MTTLKLESLRTPLLTLCPRAEGRAGQGIPYFDDQGGQTRDEDYDHINTTGAEQ